jgi:hypothetical protein
MQSAKLTQTSAINPGTTQTVSIGAASAATAAAIGANLVRLVAATVACYVANGPSPTATATSMYLAPNVPEYFLISANDKIAVLQVSSAGTLFITPAT